MLLTITDFLESAQPANARARAEAAFKGVGPYPFSYMIRVVTPRAAGGIGDPVRVFRVDASGLSENQVGASACMTPEQRRWY